MNDVEMTLALALGLLVASLFVVAYLVGRLKEARKQADQFRGESMGRLEAMQQYREDIYRLEQGKD